MRRALTVLGLCGLGACSFDLEGATGVENHCTTSSECTGGSVCELSSNRCIAPTSTGLDLFFEVTPPPEASGRMPVVHILGPERIDGPAERCLAIPGIISVFGDVCQLMTNADTLECDGRVSASLSFRPTRDDGLPTTETAVLTVEQEALAPDGQSADYVARLLQDQEYDVEITPVGDAAESYYPVTTRIRTPREGDVTRISLRFWEERSVFRGRVVNVVDNERTPVEGVVVRALDRETGDVVSATATTDLDGLFDLILDPSRSADFVLRLDGGEASSLFPTLIQDPTFFFPGTARPTILAPRLSPVTVRGMVETMPAGADVPETVPGATLTFRNEAVFDGDTGLSGQFEMGVTTDDTGRFEASLLRGTYDVIVSSPPNGDGGGIRVYREQVFEADTTGRVWVLPNRVEIAGQVTSPSQEGMRGVRVSATALGTIVEAIPEASYNRSNETTTEDTGNYVLPLDVGSYDLYLKPPSDSGFPWTVEPNLLLDSPEARVSRSVSLVAPMPVTGRLVSSECEGGEGEGEGVANAEIRALAYIETNGTLRTLPVGRTTTDADGYYVLLLPPSL